MNSYVFNWLNQCNIDLFAVFMVLAAILVIYIDLEFKQPNTNLLRAKYQNANQRGCAPYRDSLLPPFFKINFVFQQTTSLLIHRSSYNN